MAIVLENFRLRAVSTAIARRVLENQGVPLLAPLLVILIPSIQTPLSSRIAIAVAAQRRSPLLDSDSLRLRHLFGLVVLEIPAAASVVMHVSTFFLCILLVLLLE